MFQSFECPNAPNEDDPICKTFSWSAQTVCDTWSPNKIADEAIQMLTKRKLLGEDIDLLNIKKQFHEDECRRIREEAETKYCR